MTALNFMIEDNVVAASMDTLIEKKSVKIRIPEGIITCRECIRSRR